MDSVELSPTPHDLRARSRRRRTASRLVAAVLLVLAGVLLVPLALGMNHSVVRDPAMGSGSGSWWQGSLSLNDTVPGDRLRAGDVITFEAPGRWAGEGTVTRRIVAVDGGEARTRGDARDRVDPWRVDLETGAFSRVSLRVPWVGAVVDDGLGRWSAIAAAALASLALLAWVRAPGRGGGGRRDGHRTWPRGRLSGVRH